jgi:peptidoglycan hydrolase CwlO-like protein
MHNNFLFVPVIIIITSYLIRNLYTSENRINFRALGAPSEELDLETQLNNCEKRKEDLLKWIAENEERIEKKKKKITKCLEESKTLENQLKQLEKIKGA